MNTPSDNDGVAKGDNGGSLYAGDKLIGLIQNVDSATEEVIALHQDLIHSLVQEGYWI